MSVTLMPRSAARKAAAYPPGPPPTTAIFMLELSDIRSFFRVAQRFQPCGIAPLAGWGFSPRGRVLSLNRKQKWLFKRLGDPAQKARSIRTVNQAMVIGEREGKNQPRLKLSVNPLRFRSRPRKTQDRDLGVVHNRSKADSTDPAQIRNRESAAFHLYRRQLLLPRLLGQLGQFHGQFDDVLLIYISNDGHQQAAIRVCRNTDMDVLFVDDFFLLHINAGVELREYFECSRAYLQRNRGDGHLATSFFGFGSETRSQLLEFRNVGAVMLCDVRNRVPCFGEMLCRLAPHSAHGNPLDLSPLAKIRQRRCGEVSGSWRRLQGGGDRREQRFGVSLHVVIADSAAGS